MSQKHLLTSLTAQTDKSWLDQILSFVNGWSQVKWIYLVNNIYCGWVKLEEVNSRQDTRDLLCSYIYCHRPDRSHTLCLRFLQLAPGGTPSLQHLYREQCPDTAAASPGLAAPVPLQWANILQKPPCWPQPGSVAPHHCTLMGALFGNTSTLKSWHPLLLFCLWPGGSQPYSIWILMPQTQG